MKEVTFRQSLLVENEITVSIPDDWNNEEIRAMCEDFPVSVTVNEAHSAFYDDVDFEEVELVGITVNKAITQDDFAILDNNTTI